MIVNFGHGFKESFKRKGVLKYYHKCCQESGDKIQPQYANKLNTFHKEKFTKKRFISFYYLFMFTFMELFWKLLCNHKQFTVYRFKS